MATFTVTTFERRTRGGSAASLVFDLPAKPGQTGWFAEVTDPDGTLQLSRLDGETVWTVDGVFRAGFSMPVFFNGFGSRCTLLQRPAADIAAALDAYAASWTEYETVTA